MASLAHVAEMAVSRETEVRIETFVRTLLKWNTKINLIAPGSAEDLYIRHVLDSAQLFPLVRKPLGSLVDLGSGGGFPGVILATLFAQDQPEAHITLIESDQRKAAFLRQAARDLGLNYEVLTNRIEQAPPQHADVVTARALAPLDRLIPLVKRHLADDGRAILLKGKAAEREIAEARLRYTFQAERYQSKTNPEGSVVVLKDLAHV